MTASGAGGEFGRYRLIARLGRGGMADVYLVASIGPDGFRKLVVLKEPLPELTGDPNFVKMFRNEARLAALLQHPNVVQTYDAWQLGPRHFLTMEYLEGQPMHRASARLGPGGPSPRARLYVVRSVLAALHYAHELCDYGGQPLDIVHRDVSPQNVFLTYDGQVKLVDFGIAKALGAPNAGTDAGSFKGKEAYAAPEQLSCEPVDRRADVFAVGILLWEALTGRPFWSPDQPRMSLLRERLVGQEPGVLDVAPQANPALAAICAKAMAFSPNDRFATAWAFLEALEAHVDAEALRTGADELGAALRSAFEAERATMRTTIEAALRHAEASPPPPVASGDIGAPTLTSLPTSPRATLEPPRRRLAKRAGVALAGLLALGAGAQLTRRAPRPAPEDTVVMLTPPGSPAASNAAAIVSPSSADGRPPGEPSTGEQNAAPRPAPTATTQAAHSVAGAPHPKTPRSGPGGKPAAPPKRHAGSGLDEAPYGP